MQAHQNYFLKDHKKIWKLIASANPAKQNFCHSSKQAISLSMQSSVKFQNFDEKTFHSNEFISTKSLHKETSKLSLKNFPATLVDFPKPTSKQKLISWRTLNQHIGLRGLGIMTSSMCLSNV